MREFFKNKNDLGKLMMLIGIMTLVPIVVLPFYISEAKYFFAFFIPSFASLASGFCVSCLPKKKYVHEGFTYNIKRGSLTVLFAWFYGILLGSVPFLFLGNMNFMQALFESASGWTTTGFTVVDVTAIPHIFLFHRSFMQFCGGMGFVLMMITIIQNKYSMSLYTFEGHNDQLSPSVIKTARTIFILYSSMFAVGTLLYIICGMPLFESVNHCMSALSTGGFSTKAGSIGEYNSVLIEAVTVLIMLLGMTNFAVLVLLTKRKFKQAAKVSELRFTGILLLVVIPLVAFGLFFGLSNSFGEAVRHSIFNVVSILSTTGFSTVSYIGFPAFPLFVLFLIMFIGGGIGSTAGGIKINRVYLLFRGAGINIRSRLSPNNRVMDAYYYRAQGKTKIDDALLKDTYVFSFLYFLTFVVSAALLCASENKGILESVFEAASLSGTVGVSMGVFSPASNIWTLAVGIIGMVIARLEINILITGFCSIVNRKN